MSLSDAFEAGRKVENDEASAFSAGSLFADKNRTSSDGLLASPEGAGAEYAPASTTRCAFVPLNPNELTPAKRRACGHSVRARGTRIGEPDQSNREFGTRKCGLGGMRPYIKPRTVLMRPATPAAVSRCPVFDLIEPT